MKCGTLEIPCFQPPDAFLPSATDLFVAAALCNQPHDVMLVVVMAMMMAATLSQLPQLYAVRPDYVVLDGFLMAAATQLRRVLFPWWLAIHAARQLSLQQCLQRAHWWQWGRQAVVVVMLPAGAYNIYHQPTNQPSASNVVGTQLSFPSIMFAQLSIFLGCQKIVSLCPPQRESMYILENQTCLEPSTHTHTSHVMSLTHGTTILTPDKPTINNNHDAFLPGMIASKVFQYQQTLCNRTNGRNFVAIRRFFESIYKIQGNPLAP